VHIASSVANPTSDYIHSV